MQIDQSDLKVFASSGSAAGANMALAVVARLYGLDTARQLASSVEYEWHEEADVDPFARFSDWTPPMEAQVDYSSGGRRYIGLRARTGSSRDQSPSSTA